MSNDASGAQAPETAEVWDTQYLPSSKAFAAFRDGLCSAFMPWSIDSKPEGGFEGRIDSFIVDNGSIARVRMTPVVASRAKLDVSHSSTECVYGNFVLAGELSIEQRGRCNVARPGDVILYDSASVTTLRERSEGHYVDVPFMIPKERLSGIKDVESVFGNVILRRDSLISPLSNSLSFLAEHMPSLSQAEVSALFDACVSLLPVAVGYANRSGGERDDIPLAGHQLREILDFVSRQISNTELSPQVAASNLGISTRYVHKLFAARGTTFGSYVTSKRLEHVRRDLTSPSCRHQPISVLAYRWGFNDLSTFNRSFKQRYGMTPTQYRAGV